MAAVPAEWQLKPHPTIPQGLPVLVCILDGWGENVNKDEWNAVHSASTPTVDALRAAGCESGRWRTVKAHGPAVGLPTDDDMGNSEVGHNALGAGQLIDQGARLVDRSLKEGTLWGEDGWKYVSEAFAEHTVHFLGLLSCGGVHSRANQLYQRACPQQGWATRQPRGRGRRERSLTGATAAASLVRASPFPVPQWWRALRAAARSGCGCTSCWTGGTCRTGAA